MFEKWNIIKILNMIEAPSTTKEYVYNKMPCINSKPNLQRSNENLLEYSIFLPLHFSFCNPAKVIETIEKYASDGTSFEWVHQKKFVGQFVIDKIEKTLTRMLKGTLIYAEITFNLLEVPIDPEFQEQSNNAGILDKNNAIGENHSKIKEIANKAKESAVNSFKENITTALLNNSLSDVAKEMVKTISNDVVKVTSGLDVANIYNIVGTYADSVQNNAGLTPYDALIAAEAVRSIPELMLKGATR